MSISSSTRIAGPYTGNGATTSFPFAFKVFASSEIVVEQTNAAGTVTTLTLTQDYTVTLNADQDANPGGTVDILVAPATGLFITLTSAVTETQSLTLTNQGGFYPQTINDALDRLTILTQQTSERVGRKLGFGLSNTQNADIASETERANKYLVFDASGLPTVSPISVGTITSSIVSDLVTMRAGTVTNGEVVQLKYHTVAGDGGGGLLRGVTGAAAGTYVDNNGTIIVPTGGDGSAAWLREISGEGLSLSWFGMQLDGITDESALLQSIMKSNTTYYVGEGKVLLIQSHAVIQNLVNTTLTTEGSGIIKFDSTDPTTTTGGQIEFRTCTNCGIRDANIRGWKTDLPELFDETTNFTTALDPALSTVQYGDGTTFFAKDFNVSLVNSIMSMDLAALTGTIKRVVTSGHIATVPIKKYCMELNDLFVSGGNGNIEAKIKLYDAVGVYMSTYSIVSGAGILSFTGASSITIELGIYQHTHTVTGATCSYDLSQIKLFSLINDALTFYPSYQNQTVFMNATTDCFFSYNRVRNTWWYVAGDNNTFGTRYVGNDIVGAAGFAGGNITNRHIIKNEITMSCYDNLGNEHTRLHTRAKAIGSNFVKREVCKNNVLRGANWAIEYIGQGTPTIVNGSAKILDNEISLTMQAISATSHVNSCTYDIIGNKLESFSGLIELSGYYLIDSTVTKNTCVQVFRSLPSGIAYNGQNLKNGLVSSNVIRATGGISFKSTSGISDGNKFIGNDIECNNVPLSISDPAGVSILKNIINIIDSSFISIASTSGVSSISVLSATDIVNDVVIQDNIIDGTNTYAVEVQRAKQLTFTGNTVGNKAAAKYSLYITAGTTVNNQMIIGNTYNFNVTSFSLAIIGTLAAGSVTSTKDNKGISGNVNFIRGAISVSGQYDLDNVSIPAQTIPANSQVNVSNSIAYPHGFIQKILTKSSSYNVIIPSGIIFDVDIRYAQNALTASVSNITAAPIAIPAFTIYVSTIRG